jgi:ribosomal protein L17
MIISTAEKRGQVREAMPFKQGKSGNPKGRPKKGETLTDLLRDKIEAAKTAREKQTRKEKIAEKLITLAEAGDLSAIKYLFDRIDGWPKESIELTDGAVEGDYEWQMKNKSTKKKPWRLFTQSPR